LPRNRYVKFNVEKYLEENSMSDIAVEPEVEDVSR
jgi:hypothetical protein